MQGAVGEGGHDANLDAASDAEIIRNVHETETVEIDANRAK